MSVNEAYAKLNRASKDLFVEWSQTKSLWRDKTCRQFEKQFIEPLERELLKSGQALEQIDAVLQRIQHECR
ncbi:MAG: hypothetical protein JW860_13630 [Sedimentisphaerales bacterium]|nr:hypothetical protein [Sedimentisphaerales bacterium]